METFNTDWQALRQLCKNIIMAENVPEADALTIADNLVDADLCGVESHGVSRMTTYMKRLQTSVISSESGCFVEQEYAGSISINGANSMGMISAKYAVDKCIEKAKESGSCFATVGHSNHYGMAGYYARLTAEAGMIGITGTNAPPNLAPWGSPQKYIGTNPIAFGIPTMGDPIVLDMAPSIVAMGKIIMAAKLGKTIPEGWVLTKDGKPTTDPVEGQDGTLIPIGGPKGSGLGIIIDILSGILSGSEFGPHLNHFWNDFENPQNVGHFFLAIDVSKFVPLEIFKARTTQMINEMKELPKNPGVEVIFMPGEIEQNNKAKRKQDGIDLPKSVYDELQTLAKSYNVEFNI